MTTTYRVLVVDDDPPSMELAANVLQTFGCAVTLAVDGQQTLEFLLAQRFNVVFMNNRMRSVDGSDRRPYLPREGKGERI